MNINQLTATRIKELRNKTGLTAEAVAQALQISKSTYSQIENGHTEITLTKVDAIAQILKVNLSEIIPVAGNTHTYNGNGGVNGNHISAHMQNNFFANNEETLKNLYETLKSTFEGPK